MDVSIANPVEFLPILVSAGIAVAVVWLVVSVFVGSRPSALEPREERYPRPLDRSRRRAIGGVCAGIARYFGWDAGTTRAAFVLLAFFTAGASMVLIYLVLWRLMPLEPMPQPQFALDDYRVD